MTDWLTEWMNEWMSEWVSEWVNEWLNESFNKGMKNGWVLNFGLHFVPRPLDQNKFLVEVTGTSPWKICQMIMWYAIHKLRPTFHLCLKDADLILK